MQPDSTEAFLEPLVGESVLAAMLFMAPTAGSLSMVALRMAQRALKSGGIAAQFGAGGGGRKMLEALGIALPQ